MEMEFSVCGVGESWIKQPTMLSGETTISLSLWQSSSSFLWA